VPEREIRIEFTGLRPGEKLFEELSYKGEKITATRHPKILRLLCEPPSFQQIRPFLMRLAGQADHLGADEIKNELKSAIPEYQPELKPLVNGREKRNGRRHPAVDATQNAFGPVANPGVALQTKPILPP
jgi:FlaA1/EpsC-like NDP-sugar epimerase